MTHAAVCRFEHALLRYRYVVPDGDSRRPRTDVTRTQTHESQMNGESTRLSSPLQQIVLGQYIIVVAIGDVVQQSHS